MNRIKRALPTLVYHYAVEMFLENVIKRKGDLIYEKANKITYMSFGYVHDSIYCANQYCGCKEYQTK